MSQEIGAIHYRMFQKVRALNDFAERLANISEEKHLVPGTLRKVLDEYPMPCGLLENHIVDGNIHASLERLIATAEEKLAFACTALSAHLENMLPDVEALGASYVKNTNLPEGASVRSVFETLDGFWVDGMPCDHKLTIDSEDDDQLVFSFDASIHPAEHYSDLRAAWSCGFVTKLGYRFDRVAESTFKISRA